MGLVCQRKWDWFVSVNSEAIFGADRPAGKPGSTATARECSSGTQPPSVSGDYIKTATDEKPQAAQQLGNEATRMRRHHAIPLTFPITLRSLLRFLWFPKPLRSTGETVGIAQCPSASRQTVATPLPRPPGPEAPCERSSSMGKTGADGVIRSQVWCGSTPNV